MGRRLLVAGHEAGLAAIGRESDAPAFTSRFREEFLPRMVPGEDYGEILRGLLGAGVR